jgi:type I restriction enzyme R subunit
MSEQPRSERKTQHRVVKLFTEAAQLGNLGYRYLGEWSQRVGNRPIERELLEANLKKRGYSGAHISAALQKLETAAAIQAIGTFAENHQVLFFTCHPEHAEELQSIVGAKNLQVTT